MQKSNFGIAIVAMLAISQTALASESPGMYSEWARRGIVTTPNVQYIDSAATATLISFDLGGTESGGAITDTVREEHLVGAAYWTIGICVRGAGAKIDSVWCRIRPEEGGNPGRNADGSLTIVRPDSTTDRFNQWGIYTFPPIDTLSGVTQTFYRIPAWRARGTMDVFARSKKNGTRVETSVWKGSDR